MSAPGHNLGDLTGPLLVFGGPYGNLQATRAVRHVAERLHIAPDHTVCTGDIVAYCADSAATVAFIRSWDPQLVQGNCEESLAGGAADCGCGFAAGTACSRLAEDWYRQADAQIGADQRTWLGRLPARIDLTWQGRRLAVVHGGIERNNRFVFPSTAVAEKEEQLDRARADIVIAGHSGLPFGQRIGARAWLNAGAIGLPANDGTRDGWYLLLEPLGRDGGRASWHRLVYDAEGAAAAMRSRGLTGGYDGALLSGLWPSCDVLPDPEQRRQGLPLAPVPLDL